MKYLDWLEISSYLGLGATIILTVHYLLGMMMGTFYKKSQYWKKIPQYLKKFTIYQLHNMAARVVIILVFFHAFILLFIHSPNFSLVAIFIAGQAPQDSFLIALGNISFYGLLALFLTSLAVFRRRISFRAWKNIHLGAYILTPLFIAHGLLLDSQLKDKPIDLLDGEKLVSWICAIILLLASLSRYYYARKHPSPKGKPKWRIKDSTLY